MIIDAVVAWLAGHVIPLAVIGGVLVVVVIGIVTINRDITTAGKGGGGGSASAGGMFGGFEEIFAPNAHSAHTELERQRRTPATRSTGQEALEQDRPIVISTLPNGQLRATIRVPSGDDRRGHTAGPAPEPPAAPPPAAS